MKNYLTNLIEEKGVSLDTEIEIEGHFGVTYRMLIEFITGIKEHHNRIKGTLVEIDFLNGNVFNYLNFLAEAMVKSV